MAVNLLAYRGRNDDGNETTATWKAAQNTVWVQAKDVNFRVRFLHQNDTGALNNLDVQLQYNRNAAGWNNVTASSVVVRASASPNLADQANLTKQLTGGTGTFIGLTAFDEANGICGGNSLDVTATGHFETEFCVQVRSADVVDGDTIQLRTINSDTGTAWGTYTAVAQLTVTAVLQASSDTIGLTETLTRETQRPIAEEVTLSEALTTRVGYRFRWTYELFDDAQEFVSQSGTITQPVADTVVFTEALIRQAGRIAQDSLGLTESRALMIGKIAADTVTLSEDLTIQAQRAFAETGGFTEVLTPILIKLLGLSDTAILTEVLRLQAAKIASDTLGLSEDVALQVGKNVAETLGLTEALTTEAQITAAQAINDTVTLTETLSRQVRRNIAESATLTEALYGGFEAGVFAEDFDLTETLTRLITTGSVVSESLGLSDVLTVQAQTLVKRANPMARRFAYMFFDDEERLEPSTADTTTQGKATADTIALAEGLVKQAAKIINENPVLSESLNRTISRVIAETVGFTESETAGILVGGDVVSFTENLATEVIFPSAGVFGETIGMTEVFRRHVARTITDTLGLTENLAKSATILRALSDSVAFTEMLSAVKTIADQVTLSETLTAVRVAAPIVPVRIAPLWEDTELHKVTIFGGIGVMGARVYGATKWTEHAQGNAQLWVDDSLHDVKVYGGSTQMGQRPYGGTRWTVSL